MSYLWKYNADLPDDPGLTHYVRCGRCRKVVTTGVVDDPEWGRTCVGCDEGYTFDGGFSNQAYSLPMDMSPIIPCPNCHLALPATGVCGIC